MFIVAGTVLAASFLSSVSPLRAQQKAAMPDPGLKPRVDAIVLPALKKYAIPGFAVGVSSHGKRSFYSYGTRDAANHPFTNDTLVEIGSCTKVVTSTLAAEAAQAGRLALNGSIQNDMPPGYQLQPAARRVSPLELADFTSGMPLLPTNVSPNLADRSIQKYTSDDFLRWVASWSPSGPLPAPYSYSNASVGLLGYLVAHAFGKDWLTLVQQKITQPLNMRDTVERLSPAQQARLAQGFGADGKPAPQWPIMAWYAAGVLRSTTEDMLTFGEANLGHKTAGGAPVPPALLSAMQLAQKPVYSTPDGIQHAMSWTVIPASPAQGTFTIQWKDGGTAGFSSLIMLNATKDLVVFVVANKGGVPAEALGREIVRNLP
jgi:CubicO group peptidase (beta-lactamase class C family)